RERTLQQARAQLSESAFASAWAEGDVLFLEEAAELAAREYAPKGGDRHGPPARSAVLADARADAARREERLRVRLDVRLAPPSAGVLPAPPAHRGQSGKDQTRPLRPQPGDPRPDDHGQLVRDDAGPLRRPDGDGYRS